MRMRKAECGARASVRPRVQGSFKEEGAGGVLSLSLPPLRLLKPFSPLPSHARTRTCIQ